MSGSEWWRFWSPDAWEEWWSRRPTWREYRAAIKEGSPRSALTAPPRPISPAWVPIGLLVFLFSALVDGDMPEPFTLAEAASTTTAAPGETTTTNGVTTTEGPVTTTASDTSTTTTSVTTTTSTSLTTVPATDESLVLDLLLAIPVELETPSGYQRELFGVWSDEDGDGCDTRAEVLIRDAVIAPEIGPGCSIGAGLWYSVYDGVWLNRGEQLHVDHVVALKEAWDSGAKDWEPGRRIAFGNDLTSPLTLIAVSSSSNSDKGDADPSNWIPRSEDDVCRYITAWVVIKAEWGLSMDESEYGRIRNLLRGPCEGTTVADAVPVWPTPPSTTTTSTAPTTIVAGTANVVIGTIRYDAPGNDVEYNDSEYVLLRNTGSGTADVGGWSLTDEAGHVITTPGGYLIHPGEELRIYTGPGDNTASRYFAGRGQAIWNNTGGDTATLRDASGQVIDTYSY